MQLSGSDGAQILWFIAGQFAVSLPVTLIFLIGIVLSVANWRKHRKISTLVFIASVIFLLEVVSGLIISALPFFRVIEIKQLQYIYFGTGILRNLISAVGFALLFWAVWSRRGVLQKIA